MSFLFSPFRLRSLELDNRIVVSPMCQYSAEDGSATDWHLAHLGQLALSGPALVLLEATAVAREGRITTGCLGLYSDENERALARVIAHCRLYGHARLGIQLSFAGRKGSVSKPWEGVRELAPEEGAWQTLSASAIRMDAMSPLPREATLSEIAAIRRAFVDATVRAARLGFDAIELHAAHGYLLHQFWSPLSNHRTDAYGGNREKRMRLVLEVFEDVRAAWPAECPLGVRISATDWIEGGNTLEDSVALARELAARGCDWIDTSTGGISPLQKIPVGPGFQVPFAEAIRREVGVPTMAVGLITDPHQAEALVAEGRADLVALARAMLYNPRWAWHAADALGATAWMPPQYERARLSRRRETTPADGRKKGGT
jgi:2,4-dienoyl-CoA reductase-like NADH-dependent reductase (Old Yellow Enzyme family)